MKIKINISFDENLISINSDSYTKQIHNLIAIETHAKKIIDIGNTAATIALSNPKLWGENKNSISFEPIFSGQNFDSEKMFSATMYLTSFVLNEIRGFVPWDKVILHIRIQNYEKISSDKRKSYENSLEGWNKLTEFSINGETLVIKNWKYKFAEFLLRRGSVIFLLLFLIAFFQIPTGFPPSLNLFILLFIAICRKWIAEVIWMLLMQSIIDKKLLRKIFDKEEENYTFLKKFSISKRLANIILGEYNT